MHVEIDLIVCDYRIELSMRADRRYLRIALVEAALHTYKIQI